MDSAGIGKARNIPQPAGILTGRQSDTLFCMGPSSGRPQLEYGLASLPLLMRIDELTKAIRIGRTSVYALMAKGHLEKVTISGRTLITRASVERLVFSALEGSQAAEPSRNLE